MANKKGSKKTTSAAEPPVNDAPLADETATTETDNAPAAETATPGTGIGSTKWQEVIAMIATTIGKDAAEVSAALQPIVGGTGDTDAADLADHELVTDEDFTQALGAGVAPARLRKALRSLRGSNGASTSTTATPVVAIPPGGNGSGRTMTAIALPMPSDDAALLEALKTGGRAKFTTADVEAAVRVYFADMAGYFGIPKTLADLMEAQAESLDEAASEEFYEVYDQIVSEKYGEVLSALKVDRRFASQKWQKKLLERMTGVGTVLHGFFENLDSWQKSWLENVSNPGALMASFAAMAGGGGAGIMPSMLEAPDVGNVLAAAEDVVNAMNKVFAGPMVPAVRTLALRAVQIKQSIENPHVATAIGAMNRDEMLKKLGVDVTSNAVRIERDTVQFMLSVLHLDKVPSGSEPAYLVQLHQLGRNIPWIRISGRDIRGTSLPTALTSPSPDSKKAGHQRY